MSTSKADEVDAARHGVILDGPATPSAGMSGAIRFALMATAMASSPALMADGPTMGIMAR